MEHWEYIKPGGYQFVWDDALFRPSMDTFLLASMPHLKKNMKICDLGSGTGLLGLLLLTREPSVTVTGIELQARAVFLANSCAVKNDISDHLTSRCMDIRWVSENFYPDEFDLVISNPPYYPVANGRMRKNEDQRRARSETDCTFEDLAQSASYLLHSGGRFCLVHRPERLTDLMCIMRTYGMEPKRLCPVCQTAGSPPSLILLEGRRFGNPGLHIETPFIVANPDGSPTDALNAAYFR